MSREILLYGMFGRIEDIVPSVEEKKRFNFYSEWSGFNSRVKMFEIRRCKDIMNFV